MKKILIYILFLMSVGQSFAQSKLTRAEKSEYADADFYFYQERFAEAHEILSLLYTDHKSHSGIAFRLGVCELELYRDKIKSEKLLSYALKCGNNEAKFYLAKIQHLNHNFDSAITLYKEYQSFTRKEKSNEEIVRYINSCEEAKRLTANPQDVLVINLGETVNSEFSEYIPVISSNEEELYFTSRRDNSTGGKLDPNDRFFEDVYYTKKQNDTWSKPTNALEKINTSTHDATAAISSDGLNMVIYRTNRQLTGGDLFITHKIGGEWKEPQLLDANINTDFQEASACFSPDGNTLYFSSNRPGGFGGRDLYRVKKLPNGEWSLPKNLGETINTELNEDSPFLDVDDRTLYFASEGHASMGGYDIFISKRRGKENWTDPENLGYPANSVEDDLYLSLTPGGKKGYYSSEKENGFGEQDIYEINFIYRQQTNVIIKGTLVDEDGNPIQGEISIIDENSKELKGVYNSNQTTGKFILILNPLVKYKMVVQSDGKESKMDSYYFEFPNEQNEEIYLDPITLN